MAVNIFRPEESSAVVAYVRFRACDLQKIVGRDGADGSRHSDGQPGHLCHGPYITLGPGHYTAGFYIRRGAGDEDGEIEIDVCNDAGRRIFGCRTVAVKHLFSSIAGLTHLDFSLDAVERECELRLLTPARAQIEVSEAVLFRRDVGTWGFR